MRGIEKHQSHIHTQTLQYMILSPISTKFLDLIAIYRLSIHVDEIIDLIAI